MTKLIICRGLPGSGKSHWAKEQVKLDYENTIRVNRDDIRTMLHDGFFNGSVTESNVIMVRDAIIRQGLKKNKTVISDDTNLRAGVVKDLVKIAEFFGAEIEVVDFDTSKEECIRRDSLRSGRANVGEDVINKMWKQFFVGGKFPKNPLENVSKPIAFEQYVPNTLLPKAFIFDIDGTCSYGTGRNMYDYTQVHTDAPHEDVLDLAKHFFNCGFEIIFLSGREYSCCESTAKWLNDHLNFKLLEDANTVGHPNGIPLIMRKTGDGRQDAIIKYEIFSHLIAPNYNVVGVFDDRRQVIDMWRKIGVRCYDVAGNDF